MIKQIFLCAFLIYASCNFLKLSIARPMLEVVDVGPQDNPGINNTPLTQTDRPIFTPEIRREPFSSSLSQIPRDDFPNKLPFSSDTTSSSRVPIVSRGEGEKSYNGHGNKWWYKVNANGDVDASPNFSNDNSVPSEVKNQVQSTSDQLKHQGHL